MKIKKKRISVEIPTVSQSDIAFLLIIFFLVTASFISKNAVTLGYPKKEALPKEVYIKEIGNIEITPEGIFFGSKKVKEENLEREIFDFPYKKVILSVTEGVTYGKVVKILGYLQKKEAEISLRVKK